MRLHNILLASSAYVLFAVAIPLSFAGVTSASIISVNDQKQVREKNMLDQGLKLVGENKMPEALAVFNQMINENPRAAEAYVNRGMVFYYQGKDARALVDFKKTIRLNPQFPLAYLGQGMVAYRKGDLEQAVQSFDKAIELDMQMSLAYYNRAIVYYETRQFEKCLKDLKNTKMFGGAVDPEFMAHVEELQHAYPSEKGRFGNISAVSEDGPSGYYHPLVGMLSKDTQ